MIKSYEANATEQKADTSANETKNNPCILIKEAEKLTNGTVENWAKKYLEKNSAFR